MDHDNSHSAPNGAPTDQGQYYAEQQQQQYEWTPEQIQQYYQQYGYPQYDYSQYGQQPPSDGSAHAPPDSHSNVAAHAPHAPSKPSEKEDDKGSEKREDQVVTASYPAGFDYSPEAYAAYYYQYYAAAAAALQTAQQQAANEAKESGQEPSRAVWLGNLHPETTDVELHAMLGRYGMIESVKLLGPPKNCAFVRFVELDSAIQAHAAMQGATIHGQNIKVGWGKPEPTPRPDIGPPPCRNLWLGNIAPEVNEEQIRQSFAQFGKIEKIRILPQKGCAFVNFATLDAAINARKSMQGATFCGRQLKINFGKEETKEGASDSSAPAQPEKPRLTTEPPPPYSAPPPDQSVASLIEKTAEFVAKNGDSFERVTREKQKGNEKFQFLTPDTPFHGFYKWILWKKKHPNLDPVEYSLAWEKQKMEDEQRANENKQPGMYGAVPPPSNLQGPSYQQLYMQQMQHAVSAGEELKKLAQLLDSLEPTKESIKVTKAWITGKPQYAKDIAGFIRTRFDRVKDFDQKLNFLYLIHDVLHHCARERIEPTKLDPFAESFLPHLSILLQSTYHATDREDAREKIFKVMKIWEDKRIFDAPTLKQLDDQMRSKPQKIRLDKLKYDERDRYRDRDYRDREYDRDQRDYRDRDNRNRDRRRSRDRDYEEDHDSKRRHYD